jgi:transmembrane sensor
MNGLPDPMREVFRDGVDEVRVQRLWRATNASVTRRVRSGRVVAGAVLAAACALGAIVAADRIGGDEASYLALADGSVPPAVATDAAPAELVFADRSVVTVAPETEVVPLVNDRARFGMRLARGRADFSVTPGGPRQWTIDCGFARVDVVGTVFSLDLDGEGLEVIVERGEVRVESDTRSWTLRAGDRVFVPVPRVARARDVEAREEPDVAATTLARDEPEAVEAAGERRVARTAPADEPASDWRTLAERGEHAEAYEVLRPEGIAGRASRASARELLLLADVARLSGHPADAVAPLERLIAEHPNDPQAPLGAVILGRVYMDSLSRPQRAVAAFERARVLGIPSALRDDVEGRTAIARLRAGDTERGRREAEAYLAARPGGRHAARLQSLLAP